MESLYLPALQSTHTEDSSPVAPSMTCFPASHPTQMVKPGLINLPALQAMHVVEAADSLYLPALQFAHTEDSSPVAPLMTCFPALHSEEVMEFVSLYWPVLQSTNASSVGPSIGLDEPAGQE